MDEENMKKERKKEKKGGREERGRTDTKPV
jgi:hypothetical protein